MRVRAIGYPTAATSGHIGDDRTEIIEWRKLTYLYHLFITSNGYTPPLQSLPGFTLIPTPWSARKSCGSTKCPSRRYDAEYIFSNLC